MEICPVQLPGRENRINEPFPAEIDALTRQLAQVLLPYLDVPYVLLGTSMGAFIAFELARHFQHWYTLPPVHLVVAAAGAPGTDLGLPAVSGLTDDEFAAAMQGRYGGIPGELRRDAGYLAAFLPALRADMAMLAAYQPAPGAPLSCPVTAVAGAADASVSAADLAGWRACTDGGFDCLELSGGHFALLGHRDEVLSRVCAGAGVRWQPARVLK